MKILIMEDPRIVPIVIQLLQDLARTENIAVEPVIAVSGIEAEARLPECDIAIIYAVGAGREVARKAISDMDMPVIATGMIPAWQERLLERKDLQFISKPYYDLKKFARILRDFARLVESGGRTIALSA